MKSYCFAIQKGGVGKTSLSVTTAAGLAAVAPTVLIDCDPQGNASGWLLPPEKPIDIELADVLIKRNTVKEAIIKTAIENLYLLPTAAAGGELDEYETGKGRDQPFCIKHLLRDIATLGFAYAIIDTHPGWAGLTKYAVYACNEVITPILGDSFASDGLRLFAYNLKVLRENMDTAAAYRRIIVNAIDRRIPQHIQVLQTVEAEAGNLAVYTVPCDPAFRLAQKKHIALQELSGIKAGTRKAINKLTADIIAA